MSWKPTKRSLHVGPKIKVAARQPLPEMAVKVADLSSNERSEAPSSTRDPFALPDFVSSLPNEAESNNPELDKFENFAEFDHGEDLYPDKLWYPGLCDSASSSWGQSVASFMSWSDEIEVETTEKVQELLDEIEHTLYGEGPSHITNKELLAECHLWRNKFPHLRVVGVGPTNLQELPSNFQVLVEDEESEGNGIALKQHDEDSEVIASHGFCDFLQPPEFQTEEQFPCDIGEDSDGYASAGAIADGASMRERVYKAVMEQLVVHVWTEALKTLEPLVRPAESMLLSSCRPNMRETNSFEVASGRTMRQMDGLSSRTPTPIPSVVETDLDHLLHVSPMSIRQVSRRSAVQHKEKSRFHNDDAIEPARFTSNVNSYNSDYKTYFVHDAPFSVLKIPKPLTYHSLGEVVKPLELRGYHSAADRKKSGVWDRRFSCVSTGHERLLKPLEEKQGLGWGSEVRLNNRSPHVKQISAPNSPAKWSRHITLPPIECLDPFSKNVGVSQGHLSPTSKNETNLRASAPSTKKKASLSPLNVGVEGEGLTRFELAKQLLEQTSDRGVWSNNGHIDVTNIREPKEPKGQWKPKTSYHK